MSDDDETPDQLAWLDTNHASHSDESTEDAESRPSGASPRARRPTMLERYTVLRQLGAGGMGKVYLAYDDRLDRRVAIKLLLHEDASATSKQRLLREAQAMARLAHANVVTVFEVGELADEVFIAMEYVQGGNLRQWLEREPRSRAEILAAFLAAGEGLAAAHAAGIVHRDFKPDNVLVGDDGRVLVADFGLAHGGREAEPITSEDRTPSSSRLETRLTRTGAAVGTPAYMAAELLHGAVGDARSDQFAFCVAVWEALFGARPFRGSTVAAVREAILFERVDEPGERDVPPWLREVLRRGLRAAPELRWPDMRTLLDALADDPEARRRRRLRVALGSTLSLGLLCALGWIAVTQVQDNARQRYWNALTEDLLELERTRSLRQARDDARRAKNATRMTAYRSYRRDPASMTREDPTAAALLLRELEGEPEDGTWRSDANAVLGEPLSHAILTGHHDTVRALVIDADGGTVYSAAADGEVRRWDASTGRGELVIRHDAAVNALALSPDERFVASASEDGTAQVWRTDAAGPPVLVVRHPQGVTDVAFDPRSTRLLSTSRAGTARIDALDGEASVTLVGHSRPVLSGRFDRRGERALTTSVDAGVRLWSVADGASLELLVGHHKPVYFAAFAADDTIVTGADDGEVRAWRFDPTLGAHVSAVLEAYAGPVTALAVHGSRVASASSDRSVRVTPIDAPDQRRAITGHDEDVWSLAFTPDGRSLVSASRDGTARVSRIDGGGAPLVLRGHDGPLLRLALDGSGRWLATGSWDTQIRLWDLDRPRLSVPLRGHARPVLSVAYDAGRDRIVSASADGVRLWSRDATAVATLDPPCPLNLAVPSSAGDIAGGCANGHVVVWTGPDQRRATFDHHVGSIRDLAFSPDGTRLLSASSDGTARLWDPASGEPLVTLEGHSGAVLRAAFGPDGTRLYTAGADGALRRWHADSGELELAFAGHTAALRAFAISDDQRLVATASDDNDARLWLAADAEVLAILHGHEQKLLSVEFDPTGSRLLTSSADATARLWSTRDGAPLRVLRGHEGSVWGAHFLDETRVVTHADDGTVRLWLLDEDADPIVLSGHAQPVFALALPPAGDWLVSGSIDGSAMVWELAQIDPDVARLRARLFEVTVACLDEAQRQRDLGETLADARAAVSTCHARYGR